jgi:CHAT domain-containing protein
MFEGARVRVGADATESAFYEDAPRARILHVAAHAWADDAHPAYSGIVLSPTPGAAGSPPADDGLVQAWEVARTRLRADLVTLSACDTGRGRWRRGEGIVGLARAFRLAGARTLLVSLWAVDDAATADLMTRFYARLLEGERPAAALRGAKLSLMRGEDAPPDHDAATAPAPGDGTRGVGRRTRARATGPAAWASFVLVGAGDRP